MLHLRKDRFHRTRTFQKSWLVANHRTVKDKLVVLNAHARTYVGVGEEAKEHCGRKNSISAPRSWFSD